MKTRNPGTILVAGKAPILALIGHLLHGRKELRVVARVSQNDRLIPHAARVLPEIIVLDRRLMKRCGPGTTALLRRRCPRARIVLIYPGPDLTDASRKCAADAYVEEQDVVTRLLPALERMTRPAPRK